MPEASSSQVFAVERAVRDVANAVRSVEMEVREVGGHVERVSAQQLTLAQQLGQLAAEFQAFVDADAMQKALQLAETRVVKVRQELETKYGHHREVRRRATGILQAMDAALVTHGSIQQTTEDVMMRTPGYWLAPALVALAGWIRDDQSLAEKALAEALRRDDHKATLFFALVLRRYRREQPSAVWVKRYFANQDPTSLDRECMVVLDAVTNGGFGPVAQGLTHSQLRSWIALLDAEHGFVDQQRERWRGALLALQPGVGDGYTYLPKHSPDWPQLVDRLGRAHLHDAVERYFAAAFDGEIPMSPRLSEQVDAILESLVTNFDDEELPLRKAERELQLIIDHDGDKAEAAARFAAEQEAYDERVSFAALLTNAAMHSEQSGASPATQRFAIALSHEWIVDAYDAVVAEGRTGVPETVNLEIDGWNATTTDGTNEEQLLRGQRDEYGRRAVAARAAITYPLAGYVAGGLSGVALLYGAFTANVVLIFLALAGASFAYLQYHHLDARRDEAERAVERSHKAAEKILRASLAEVVDWREEWATADAKAEDARRELASISPAQHTKTHSSDGRGVMTA